MHAMLSSVDAGSSLIIPTTLTLTTPDQLLLVFEHSSQVSPLPGNLQWSPQFGWSTPFLGIHFFWAHSCHGSYHTVLSILW